MRASVAHLISMRPWALDRTSAAYARLSRLAMDVEADVEIDLPAFEARAQAASYLDRMGAQKVGTVEIIPVHNMITQHWSWLTWVFDGTALDWLREAIAEAVNDPTVSSIVLDIDSPGGEVYGLTEFAADLRRFAALKPIATFVNPLCASAAVWIGSQAGEVIVTPSGMVGSVGIIAMHVDQSAMLERIGLNITLIHSGDYKTEGNPYQPLTDAGTARLQLESDHYEDLFYSDLGKGRNLSVSQMRENFGQGRLLLPAEALSVGMVDRVATYDATVKRLGGSKTPANASVDAPRLRASTDEDIDLDDVGDPELEQPGTDDPEIDPTSPSETAEEGEPTATAIVMPVAPQFTPAQAAAGAARFNQRAHGAPRTPPWAN